MYIVCEGDIVMIIHCDCKSDYQDDRYGKALRVMNPTKEEKAFRCTVCAKVQLVGKSPTGVPSPKE